MAYEVKLSKDRFKFSATHFTMFSESEAERLHGHNYQVSLTIGFKALHDDTGLAAEFSELKTVLKEICDRLDEKVLLPNQSPFLSIGKTETNYEIKYSDRFYSFPINDCQVLEIVNTSSECLAQWVHEQLQEPLKALGAQQYAVTVQETLGQAVTYS